MWRALVVHAASRRRPRRIWLTVQGRGRNRERHRLSHSLASLRRFDRGDERTSSYERVPERILRIVWFIIILSSPDFNAGRWCYRERRSHPRRKTRPATAIPQTAAACWP